MLLTHIVPWKIENMAKVADGIKISLAFLLFFPSCADYLGCLFQNMPLFRPIRCPFVKW